MPSPPSRRRTLRALGSIVGAGLAGCLDPDPVDDDTSGTTPGPSTTSSRPTTSATTTASTTTATPRDDVHVGIRNEADETRRVEIEVANGSGEGTLFSRTYAVNGGTATLAEGAGAPVTPPGPYAVTARLESGEEASYEWQLNGALGDLIVVITPGSGVEFAQQVRCSPACDPVSTGGSAVDLPYAVPGAEETFAEGAIDVENDGDETVPLTVELRHDGEPFFDYTYAVTPEREISVGGVTATAGTYDVAVTTADGERAEYAWEIPPEYAWPRLTIRVDSDGTPRVGCGPGGPTGVSVESEADRTRTVTLRLARAGSTVDETERTVEPGATTSAEVTPPIGGRYTLTVETGSGGRVESPVRFCYCLTESVVVQVGDDDIRFRQRGRVCQ